MRAVVCAGSISSSRVVSCLHVSRRCVNFHGKRDYEYSVKSWWLKDFDSSALEKLKSPWTEAMPEWPVDEVEFNTQLPDGGHSLRVANAQQQQTLTPSFSEDAAAARSRGLLLNPSPLTDEEGAAVKEAEKTSEGARALTAGGWVCASCLGPMPYRSRSICDTCHTLRHDAERTVNRWRRDSTNWICSSCAEFNFERDASCRCCASARPHGSEVRPIYHERVADEVQRAHIGDIVNVRNRFCRWRCPSCREVNSLQSSVCRSCQHERFDMNLTCVSCNAVKAINNRAVYGNDPKDQHHLSRTFGAANVIGRLSSGLRCDHCQALMHGAKVAGLGHGAWWCACGSVNQHAQPSCARCRLPRTFPSSEVTQRLLAGPPSSPQRWDIVGSSNWFCEACDGVNRASRHTVCAAGKGSDRFKNVQSTTAAGGDSSPQRNATRMVHGDAECRHCRQPWHHQLLQDGDLWRCACHQVNGKGDAECSVCGLPNMDGIRVSILSLWTKGDWMCSKCKAHNYRDKVRCVCGNMHT